MVKYVDQCFNLIFQHVAFHAILQFFLLDKQRNLFFNYVCKWEKKMKTTFYMCKVSRWQLGFVGNFGRRVHYSGPTAALVTPDQKNKVLDVTLECGINMPARLLIFKLFTMGHAVISHRISYSY